MLHSPNVSQNPNQLSFPTALLVQTWIQEEGAGEDAFGKNQSKTPISHWVDSNWCISIPYHSDSVWKIWQVVSWQVTSLLQVTVLEKNPIHIPPPRRSNQAAAERQLYRHSYPPQTAQNKDQEGNHQQSHGGTWSAPGQNQPQTRGAKELLCEVFPIRTWLQQEISQGNPGILVWWHVLLHTAHCFARTSNQSTKH